MKVRIALAGELPSDQHLFGKIDLLFDQITGYLCKEIEHEELQMLVSPSYTGKEWMNWSGTHGISVCTYNMQKNSDYLELCSQSVRKDTHFRNLLGEAMCDKADALLVVWNEDVTELSGATWEFMRIAYDRKLPCVWISTKSQKVYCLWDSYYEKYSPDYLENVCVPLHEEDMQPMVSQTENNRFLSFWKKRRSDYLSKYRADVSVHEAEDDLLLKQEFRMEKEASGGEKIRRILLEKYQQFDSAAIDSNSIYQAMIYQRSVLPFIATVFLAIGFYAETLLGTTISVLAPGMKLAATVTALIIAGLGFLAHGTVNLYTYRLSKNSRIQQWQKDFINNRYIAEMMRMLIHFLPYGISLNLRKLCGENEKLYVSIKHLTDDAESDQQNVNRENMHYALQHVKEMLDDQLSYHNFSVNRYEKIVNSLEEWGKRIMYIGFAVVIGRGVLQFALVLLKVVSEVQNPEIINSDVISISRSFLNMMALLLPAWAGYFTTKVQQNNFRYNLDNHQRMISELNVIREKVIRCMDQEEIPMEVINVMITELSETMILNDTMGWYYRYMDSVVKPL